MPRREDLAAIVARRGFVRVTDVARELAVSEVTIRADLAALERSGSITRVHGGAMPVGVVREQSLESTLDRDAAAKTAIGRACAALVSSGDSIYIDPGSTAMALAEALVSRTDLHDLVVVTSGLTIALELEAAIPRFTVIVTGGTLRPLQHSLVNPFAAPMLDALAVDLAFIGCNGVDATAGATNLNLPDAEIKSRVIRSARRSILMADSSKLGRRELALIAPLAAFERLVTAGEASERADLGDLVVDRVEA